MKEIKNNGLPSFLLTNKMTKIKLYSIIFSLVVSPIMTATSNYFPNYDEAKVPAYVLPEILRFEGGSLVDMDSWSKRRVELLGLFEKYIYGVSPRKYNLKLPVTVTEDASNVPNGCMRRIQLKTQVDDGLTNSEVRILVYLPANAESPIPVLLAPNFRGNHAMFADPEIELSPSWFPGNYRGIINHRATNDSRALEHVWPLNEILASGFGIATFYYGDVAPDQADQFRLISRRLYEDNRKDMHPDGSYGAIGLWAAGCSRALDALQTIPEIDSQRVGLVGHSRLGKTALWAGAQDTRFALVAAVQSGAGGASLFRRRYGQTLDEFARPTSFPYWFNDVFHSFANRENELPIDQHQLLALIAPRALVICSAAEDHWADPLGEFLAAKSASVVWSTMGLPCAIENVDRPRVNEPIFGKVSYIKREGTHALQIEDWAFILKCAKQEWRSVSRSR
jgi:hypothetical protein